MLANATPTSILPVADLDAAAAFYGSALGLEDQGSSPDGNRIFGLAGGASLALMQSEPGSQTGHTVLSWEVEGIEEAVGRLEAAGVVFEDYDSPELTTVDHICVLGSDKAAWFTDPSGNILCLHELGSR